jgi:hypothetical protein
MNCTANANFKGYIKSKIVLVEKKMSLLKNLNILKAAS